MRIWNIKFLKCTYPLHLSQSFHAQLFVEVRESYLFFFSNCHPTTLLARPLSIESSSNTFKLCIKYLKEGSICEFLSEDFMSSSCVGVYFESWVKFLGLLLVISRRLCMHPSVHLAFTYSLRWSFERRGQVGNLDHRLLRLSHQWECLKCNEWARALSLVCEVVLNKP